MTVQILHLDRRTARRILKLLNLHSDENPRAALRQVCDSIALFRSVHDFQQGSPAAAEIRKRIVALGRNATAIRDEVVALQPFLEALPPSPDQQTPYVSPASLLDDLNALAMAASMPGKVKLHSGRPADRALAFLIVDLADLFHACTGKEPSVSWRDEHRKYEGNFLELIATCVTTAGIEMTNNALGMSIRRALKNWTADQVKTPAK